MKVCHTSEIFTFQKTLILQLQLTLELSQIQEILSTYTDFLLLFAEYPYLFNFFKNEPIPLKGKNKLFYNNFITQDPARDGGNWYGYCGNNPLCFLDPDGQTATGVVLGWIGTDVAVPEPTDLIPWKWVGYGAAIAGATIIDHCAVKNISKAIEKSKTKEKPKNYVYHMTGSLQFSKKVEKNGVSEIDPNYGPGTSRFGNKFYVAGDKATSLMEATNPGIMMRFSMSEDAKILDLTNADIANSMGYKMGLTHEESQKLMQSWDLTGIDAIKYPSEKNPAGVNYGVINPTILTFEGIEGVN